MTTTAGNATVQTAKATLELARNITLKMIDDIPADKTCHQAVRDTNHAVWVLGHTACTDDYFRTTLGGGEPVIDGSWNELFGGGSKPSADASAYPPIAEIKVKAAEAREAFVKWIDSLDDDTLNEPLPEKLSFFAPNHAGLPITIAWHEGFHAGQVSAIRRDLGLPNAMEM